MPWTELPCGHMKAPSIHGFHDALLKSFTQFARLVHPHRRLLFYPNTPLNSLSSLLPSPPPIPPPSLPPPVVKSSPHRVCRGLQVLRQVCGGRHNRKTMGEQDGRQIVIKQDERLQRDDELKCTSGRKWGAGGWGGRGGGKSGISGSEPGKKV